MNKRILQKYICAGGGGSLGVLILSISSACMSEHSKAQGFLFSAFVLSTAL